MARLSVPQNSETGVALTEKLVTYSTPFQFTLVPKLINQLLFLHAKAVLGPPRLQQELELQLMNLPEKPGSPSTLCYIVNIVTEYAKI